MTENELWNEYCENCHIDKSTPYEAWSFGDDPDTLAELVRRGIKTATCSLFDLYGLDADEALPKAGDISIILNGRGEAVCIIKNTNVCQAKFCEISAAHALKEGEGDRSLAYWRKVHTAFFTEEAREYGIRFDENSMIFCEEFEVVYRHEG